MTVRGSRGGTLRQRMLAAAVELTTSEGWAHVTMSRLAQAVGVSRQTVYNEIGTKNALAEAMILAELETFLAGGDHARSTSTPTTCPTPIEAAILGRAPASRRTTRCCTRSSRRRTAPTPSCCRC